MGSYGQWFNSREKKHPARLTWICGSSPLLTNEVVDWIKLRTKATVFVQRQAGDGASHVWDSLRSNALGTGSSLVVIRQAEVIEDAADGWRDLPGLMDVLRLGRVGDRYVVFVSSQPDTWLRDVNGKAVLTEESKKQHLPHVAQIMKSTMCDVVVCSTLSGNAPTNKYGTPTRSADAVLWLQSFGVIGEKEANYLIQKTGGDLYEMKNVMLKVAAFDSPPTIGVIDALTGGSKNKSAPRTFTEHLIAGQKREALLLAADWTTPDLSLALKRLDRALDALAVLHVARRNHQTRSVALKGAQGLDDRERSRLSSWDVDRYWNDSASYDQRRRAHCRTVLGTIDKVLANWPEVQAPNGCVEALVAMW